jgi:excinuclease ABC subunit A
MANPTILSPTEYSPLGPLYLEVLGARVHNLKNIDLRLPRNQLVIITGVSGSGKSSLAFDTIYAEGQRRYIETFTSYARSFIGELARPDVDKINGLSPVIAIEQKTTSRNPRSTVGTVTEIYDYLRVLFAKIADAYSYLSSQKMVRQTEQQMEAHLLNEFLGKNITLLSPIVRGRKGHYRELLEQIRARGFTSIRIDGEIKTLRPGIQLDRYKVHDIEIVIDRLVVEEVEKERLHLSLKTALQQSKGTVLIQEEATDKTYYFSKAFTDPTTGLSYEEPAPNTFSFNSPYGACPVCEGLGTITSLSRHALMPDPTLSLLEGGLSIVDPANHALLEDIKVLFDAYGILLDSPVHKLPDTLLQTLLYGNSPAKPATKTSRYPDEIPLFTGLIPALKGSKASTKKEEGSVEVPAILCPQCQGARLKKTSLHFKLGGKNIAELAQMNLVDLQAFLHALEPQLEARKQRIAEEPLKEISKRIQFLLQVGLYYLCLDRPLNTLSGGEAQRIRLANQIGTQLVGVLYILDEPSIGLHPRDNTRLIKALQDLRDLGNSVMVVEHDKEIMLQADYLVDIGPGAGKNGGEVVAAGPTEDFLLQPSITSDFLKGTRKIAMPIQRRKGNGKFLTLTGCTGHNLKDVTVKLPLATLTCITGVSGSGKSTLIHRTLYPLLQQHLYRAQTIPLPYHSLKGLANIDHVIAIDQKPIGRTPRSNPATYTNLFVAIRNLFTQLPTAKIRGYEPGRFSFNVQGGRCEKCQGGGMRVIEMEFLPDVYTPCEECQGKRYNRQTLEIHYKGKSIADVLEMTISHALVFFEKHPTIRRVLQVLEEVGLGYLTLGQSATTLSGGEAQRIKLASELAKRSTGQTLYILDEPTTGLHFQDIQHLLAILQRLADQGNTILVIEHNLDIIKTSDYIIDMGPEGGQAGGKIVATGTPEEVSQHPTSLIAPFLKAEW